MVHTPWFRHIQPSAADAPDRDSLLEMKKRSLRRSALFLIVTSLANVGVAACAALAPTTLCQYPNNLLTTYFVSWFMIQLSSTMQILTFQPAMVPRTTPHTRTSSEVRDALSVSAIQMRSRNSSTPTKGKNAKAIKRTASKDPDRVHPSALHASVLLSINEKGPQAHTQSASPSSPMIGMYHLPTHTKPNKLSTESASHDHRSASVSSPSPVHARSTSPPAAEISS